MSRQQICGIRKRAENRLSLLKKNKDLMGEVKKLRRKLWAVKKNEWRRKKKISTENLSPKSQVNKITKGFKVSRTVFQSLKVGCALKAQLRESFKSVKSRKERAIVSRFIAGKVLKSERLLKSIRSLVSFSTSFKHERKPALVAKEAKKGTVTEKSVHNFLESTRASTVCPGKRQGKRYAGVERQKRYMSSDLKSLYKEYLKSGAKYVSYRTFCRHKPKWVVTPKLTSRDTCLCQKCENIKLLAKALKSQGLLVSNLRETTNSVCCDPPQDICLLRTCEKCKDKNLLFAKYDGHKPALFYKWSSCREQVYSFKLKKEIEVNILKKTSQYVTVEELKQNFERDHVPYMMHIGRNLHQTQAFEALVKTLDETEMLFLMDWSMNYVCKYRREPQSVHFGASHKQLGFHTGRLYTSGNAQSTLTISEITRHDPCAIIAHIVPVLTKYLEKHKQVTKLQFGSDGPVTQYRNRNMYYLLIHHVTKLFPQIIKIDWRFSEAGHGKSEADAVGGLSKRACDKASAFKQDVDSIEKVQKVITEKCPSIDLFVITLYQILAVDSITIPKTSAVEGTMKMHHYTWMRKTPNEIIFKELSCMVCPREEGCSHFQLGKPWCLNPSKEVPKAAAKNSKQKSRPKKAKRSSK